MDALAKHGCEDLGMGRTERRVVDSFWDLRDDAHDHPDRWKRVTPEELFQKLAEYVEEAEERGPTIDWGPDVTERLLAWRTSEGAG